MKKLTEEMARELAEQMEDQDYSNKYETSLNLPTSDEILEELKEFEEQMQRLKEDRYYQKHKESWKELKAMVTKETK